MIARALLVALLAAALVLGAGQVGRATRTQFCRVAGALAPRPTWICGSAWMPDEK